MAPPLAVMPPESGNPLERITSPYPIAQVYQSPVTPPPSLPTQMQVSAMPDTYSNAYVADQAIHRLNEAAQRIAEVEHGNRRMPRASRLAPIRDISADIQRESTPLPQIAKVLPRKPGQLGEQLQQRQDLEKHIPDFWPWHDADADESEGETWTNHTDPLLGRHFPNSAEIARIEEEDMRRAVAEGLITVALSPSRKRMPLSRGLVRVAFIIFTILAIAFLVVDGVLFSLAIIHPRHSASIANGPPSLTLSANVVTVGQTVTLHVQHFSANTHVFLTHDIQEMVQLTTGSSLITVGANGSASVIMLVDASWGPGYHTIEAEDVKTRYTASATLQIAGAGPTRPSHLLIDTTSLNLGTDYQGANTIQTLTLHNAGGGSISWAASSDQPWLLLSPSQGIFSASQTISVAVERANLKPGDYKGNIGFSSDVGPAENVQVNTVVRPLHANVGAVMAITPPVLSFTALDGGTDPSPQVLMMSNPGLQPLNWTLAGNNQVVLTSQTALFRSFNTQSSWLTTDQSAGVVVAQGTSLIHIFVNSHNLLPGVYTDVLVFTGNHGAFNSPQSISVSLTIQPRCGLTLNTGIMSFTAVSGQSNPSNQSLGFSATSSCTGIINWKAISAASWLTVTPASGQLKGSTSTVTAVGVNTNGVKPGTYNSNIAFLAGQSTQTVMVQLVVQPPPPPGAPVLGATPLNLNFSTTQGMANPPGQVVTITNTGTSELNWHTTVNTLATSWLGAGPTGGSIPAGQTGQVTININTAGLTPNTYVGQVILIGVDNNNVTSAGSPQTITVNLLVVPPCTLEQPSLSEVSFSAVQGSADPNPQPVAITASGNCSWPLSWHAVIARSRPWLKLSSMSGSFAQSGQSISLQVMPTISGLAVGTYRAQVSIIANDVSNTSVQGSPQTFLVTLTVLQPCTLQVNQSSFVFTVAQGQAAPPAQPFSLSEVGSCVPSVSWSATGDANSTSWLVLAPATSGTGSATVNVSVNSQSLLPGVYSGTITVSASGSGGAVIQGSPQTLNVTLTVTGFTLSGTVVACVDQSCSSSSPLALASLSLVNNTTNQTVTATADNSGNFTFSGLALGPYTLTATGSNGTINYAGSVTLTITGNQINLTINAIPK
ncbi:MAG: hypothetical protein NVS4B7_00650 [Ktedonobacteraceae bacterium]